MLSKHRVSSIELSPSTKEDLHPWVRVDQAEGLCHRKHLAFWKAFGLDLKQLDGACFIKELVA